MGKSKFFAECTNHHTFSLDHVVAIKRYDRYSVHDRTKKIGNIIEIALLVGGKKEDLVVWFGLDEEKERDVEYRRLSKALTKNNS